MMFCLAPPGMSPYAGILFVCPSTVMTEFQGMQTGFFLVTYCDLSYMSGFIIKILLIFYLYTGHLFFGVLFVPAVGTQFE